MNSINLKLKTKLHSYAKINLGLRILGKREDGYHDLETIFYPVRLHDEILIGIEKSEKNSNSVVLKSNKSFIPLNKDNLCYKAVEKFFTGFMIKDFYKIDIELTKNIPVGGGMGGGSSNAASVIKYLVRYFGIDVEANREKLMNLALSIGSDVPFFLIMKPCYAAGRGEKLKILREFKIYYNILIVNPNLHVSTKWAFEKLNLQPGKYIEPVLDKVNLFNPDNTDLFVNDFEEIVFKKFEILGRIKNELQNSGAIYSSLSGSGAAVFAFYEKNKVKEMLHFFDRYKSNKYFAYISS